MKINFFFKCMILVFWLSAVPSRGDNSHDPGFYGKLEKIGIKVAQNYSPKHWTLPLSLPESDKKGKIYLTQDGKTRLTTLNGEIQDYLTEYLRTRGSPISAIVVTQVKTGKILAMVQGRHPSKWNSQVHSALYNGFPAASLFKTVVAAAVFDSLNVGPDFSLLISGNCLNIEKNGVWLLDYPAKYSRNMSFKMAYGKSCNAFFARLSVDLINLNTIYNYAEKMGFANEISSDFVLEPSPLLVPKIEKSSIFMAGEIAAGFGLVGLSPVHAAWIHTVVANQGVSKPMIFFDDTEPGTLESKRIISKEAANEILESMKSTTIGGTARNIFHRKRYRDIAPFVGGKTGTLAIREPFGIVNWYVGVMPVDNPEVVVAAVTVLEKRWLVKSTDLGAETLWAYHKIFD